MLFQNTKVFACSTLLTKRWLLDNDHDEDGMIVLAKLHGDEDITSHIAREEYREIKRNIPAQRAEGQRSYLEMFSRYRTRLLIAMSFQAFAQLNGIAD